MSNEERKYDLLNQKTDEGKCFVCEGDDNIAAVTKEYVINVGTKALNLIIAELGSMDTLAEIQVSEAPTVTVVGTAISVLNRDRRGVGETTDTTVFEDPTTTADGTVLYYNKVTAESKDPCDKLKYILKASTIYLIKITNPNAGPLDIWINLAWYEGV
jgi:hypothetical protein